MKDQEQLRQALAEMQEEIFYFYYATFYTLNKSHFITNKMIGQALAVYRQVYQERFGKDVLIENEFDIDQAMKGKPKPHEVALAAALEQEKEEDNDFVDDIEI